MRHHADFAIAVASAHEQKMADLPRKKRTCKSSPQAEVKVRQRSWGENTGFFEVLCKTFSHHPRVTRARFCREAVFLGKNSDFQKPLARAM
jgi:hypothetical protein